MKKQISGGIILSFISQLISIILGLVYMPIMIKILGQNEYGLYQLVQSVVNYLNLMNFGFSGAYIRYYSIAKANDDETEIANLNGMFMRIFMLISLLCIIAGWVLYINIGILGKLLTADDYIMARKLLVILVLNMAVSFPSSMFTVYLSANEKFIFQQSVNVVVNILIPLLTLPLLWCGYGSIGVVMITLLLSIGRLLINAWYCFKKLNMKLHLRYFSKIVFLDLLGFTFFIFLSDIVDQMNTNVDKFLLGRIRGTISVAIYSVGFNLCNYYRLFSWMIPEMFIPEANRIAIEEKDDKKLTEIFTRIGCYNNYLLLLVLTGFILAGKPFVQLLFGPEYERAYDVGLILMASSYIPSIQTLGIDIQNAKNKHKVRSVIYFGIACLNVIVSVFLIRRWGEIGTSQGTFASVLLGSGLFMNIYYHRNIGLDVVYFWKEVLKWTIPALLFCLATKILIINNFNISSWVRFLVFIFGYAVVYFILLWFIGLKQDERKTLTLFLVNRKNRMEC